MQTPGQAERKWVVSANANGWSSGVQFRTSKPKPHLRPCLFSSYYSCECSWSALSEVASFSPPLHAVIRPRKQIKSMERSRVTEVFMGMPFKND